MKKICLFMGLMMICIVFPISAQNYGKLWKEVESLQKKDLPRSVIEKSGNIFSLAMKDKNLPQMMKAFMVCSEYKVRLSPDSLQAQKEKLKEWTVSETDTVGKAVLNSIMAMVYAAETSLEIDSVISCLRMSLQEKELLASRSAALFHPVVVSKDLSKEYFGDNMYDFLARQAVRTLLSVPASENKHKIHNEILGIYDSLVGLYSKTDSPYRDRKAEALTREARLVYLSDNCVHSKDKLSSDDAINEFKKLASEYQDIDVYCDIILKLANKYMRRERMTDAMTAIREALKTYPETEWTDDLRNLAKKIESPFLSMSMPFIYPGYETEIKLIYNNITDITIEAYRLNLAPSSEKLGDRSLYGRLVAKNGILATVNNYSLVPASDYKNKTVELKYKLPEAGIYIFKLYSKQKPDVVRYDVSYVSPYDCVVRQTSDGMKEFIAVDRMTGHPVPHAELVYYRKAGDGYEESKVYTTDSQGSVMLKLKDEKSGYFNVRTSGNDFMRIEKLYFYIRDYVRNEKNSQEKSLIMTDLFTDRSIYRPGQKVHVSGVQYVQTGDSVSVIKGSEVIVTLFDANGKEVEKAEVTTDEFGVFDTEFMLKQNAMPGYFNIKAGNTYSYVKVEEYKRPTFDVVFEKLGETYSFGDTVRAEGKAMTFAGAPVRMAAVEYRILRANNVWRNWGGRGTEFVTGKAMTDADGKFHVDFQLEKPKDVLVGDQFPNTRFSFIATVTSTSGETQTGDFSVFVGEKSLELRIVGLPAQLAKEKIDSIMFEASNYEGMPVRTVVKYSVSKHAEDGSVSAVPMLTGENEAGKLFVPNGLRTLPSGKYRMEIAATDIKGREVTFERYFTLFSLDDKHVPYKTPAWFYKDDRSSGNERSAVFYVGSSEKDVYLMVNVYTVEKMIEKRRVNFSDSILKFEYKYKEEYGDKMSVSMSFMRKGKLYSDMLAIYKPKPEKKLAVKWKTFRDKLVPGQKEEWKLSVRDKDGKPVKASMLASAYDASLDNFYSHRWDFGLSFVRRSGQLYSETLNGTSGFSMLVNYPFIPYRYGIDFLSGNGFTQFMPFSLAPYGYYQANGIVMIGAAARAPLMSSRAKYKADAAVDVAATDGVLEDKAIFSPVEEREHDFVVSETRVPSSLRENFSETAFYYPRLHTDSTGTVTMSFVMPDALTKWNFNGFVHTKDMDYGFVKASFTTSKPFMVQPNMPRFVRVGDESSISSSLINMSDGNISGKVTMTMSNPINGKVVYSKTNDFNVREGETGVVTFNYKVTEGIDVLVCTVMAEAGEFSDGERHYLPVLSDKQLIVENIPAQLREDETKTVDIGKLFNGGSQTATNKKLTVEMTANPQWYVVQALPALGTPFSDDAMSWATALYANSLSLYIVKSNPRIKQVFDTWVLQGKSDKEFWSELSSNEELKNIIIEETPWLAEAEDEASRKQRIALLFDVNGMNDRFSTAVTNLAQLQLEDGSWPWFKGMLSSPYITLQVVQSLARLKSLGITFDSQMNNVYKKAIGYLSKEAAEWHSRIIKNKNTYWPQYMIMHYLYICAIDKDAARLADAKVNSYFTDYFMDKSASLDIQEKSVMATVMDAAGKRYEAKILLQSVMEYMVSNEEMGSYFDTYKAGYSSCDYRIPTHVSAMEAIMRLGENKDTLLDDMRLWLLKQKQVQVWDTPVSSVNAIYAFLACGEQQLDSTSIMTASVCGKTITTPDDAIGHVSVSLQGSDIEKVQTVDVSRKGPGIGWCYVYSQCLEIMDKVKMYNGNGLKIERKYMCGDKEVSSSSTLSVGDKITVCITVSTDRDMDFVRIKDEKPACLEVASQLSSYSWCEGLSFYRVNKDASVEFFVDSMRKGTYTLSYDTFVTRSGVYISGPASIISVYAPQFGSHTEGFKIGVR